MPTANRPDARREIKGIDRTTLSGSTITPCSRWSPSPHDASSSWRDLDINGHIITIHFWHTKGNKPQFDTLSPQVAGALRRYLTTL